MRKPKSKYKAKHKWSKYPYPHDSIVHKLSINGRLGKCYILKLVQKNGSLL